MASENKHKLNIKFEPVEEERMKQLLQDFPNYLDGLVRGNPGGFLMTPRYAERAEDVYNFQVRPDDYWLVTFPKCGTNWMQELMWLVGSDCDFETAKKLSANQRSHFLEMSFLPPKAFVEKIKLKVGDKAEGHESAIPFLPFEKVADVPSPRFIKTHLPFYLLPPDLLDTAKVVYVARNPKDVIVSFFYHHKLIKLNEFNGTLEEFADYFLKDEVVFTPFFAHILEAWNMRQHPNLLFVFYEDMKADLAGEIRKVANFFNKPVSEENVQKLVDHLKFDSFAKNESVNNEHGKKTGMMKQDGNFIRKGKTGDWKNHFSPELNARIDQWIANNLSNTDLKFVTELEKQD